MHEAAPLIYFFTFWKPFLNPTFLLAFEHKLAEQDWTVVFESNDADKAWDLFKGMFLAELDIVGPMKEVRIKQSSAKWMTAEFLDLITAIYGSLRSLICILIMRYVQFRNQARYKIQKAKSQYYMNAGAENVHQPKKTVERS